jgi:hypothetical protein
LNNIRTITEEFPVDAESPQKVDVRIGKESTLYKVENSCLITTTANLGDSYLIESTAGVKIACHPHIVGEELRGMCLKAAKVSSEWLSRPREHH